jgi:transposase
MRYGTRTHCRRRWTRTARRPVCKVKIGYKWGYLYVAICPYTGDVFACLLTHLNKICFNIFIKEFKEHLINEGIIDKEEKLLIIGDGATAHQKELVENHGLNWEKLPAACPELNPVERFFEELRKYTANQVFEELTQVETCIENLVKEYMTNPLAVSRLTLFSYLNT